MEKEEKIAQRERIAEEMSFYGRLRRGYPAFALFYVSVLRLLLHAGFSVKTQACTFIFGTQCLTLVNLPFTILATFVTQTLVGNLIEHGSLWPIPQEMLLFYAVYSVLLAALSLGLKTALKVKEDDKDPVLQSVVGGSLIFVVLELFMPLSV
mmetsp:Transcript_29229/g.36305  ORF Transcript_29229/g.36305 Transcript_29229/m.36305 type:complete len:152 (+) Transcript_29229:31-486(+)|eukprot:CAMPEP_0170461702 /NCGR_PEP_ID=MMETSP0123-20130129/7500_1 /TAXON_ID=182087 /ORGANISM="Favella ehrenbergii, Strain Fehren 1" /LENGTH=151 /DNA_ID=CAMNT_0010726771 /DNA_START=30 /DNA_END=485 /DNA_ORIENTATION=+